MKRVFIIHCWEGGPEDFWYSWLKTELEKKGFEVYLPEMPDTDNPRIGLWVKTLQELVGEVDKDTYFVGHSIGCQTIFRYLSALPENTEVGGVVCVAGWFNLLNIETEEKKEIARPWLETSLDKPKLKLMLKERLVAIFSDDDPYVPLSDSKIFKETLGAYVIVQKNKGHYDEQSILELSVVLEELLKMAK